MNGFCAVPHILEMLLEKIRSAGKDLEGFKKKIYFWAFNAAEKYDSNNQSAFYKLKYKIADRLIYSKWRAKLGGNELLIISGGTAVQPKIIRLFTAAKMHSRRLWINRNLSFYCIQQTQRTSCID